MKTSILILLILIFTSGFFPVIMASTNTKFESGKDIGCIYVYIKSRELNNVKTGRSQLMKSHSEDYAHKEELIVESKRIDSIISILDSTQDVKKLNMPFNSEVLTIEKTSNFDLANCQGFKYIDSVDVCGFIVICINLDKYFIWINDNSIDYEDKRYFIDNVADKILELLF